MSKAKLTTKERQMYVAIEAYYNALTKEFPENLRVAVRLRQGCKATIGHVVAVSRFGIQNGPILVRLDTPKKMVRGFLLKEIVRYEQNETK